MNGLNLILILLIAFLVTFWEASGSAPRHWLGTQVDLLPALVAAAGLSQGFMSVTLAALFGGLWFDSLSANPLGISILPLFLVGWVIHYKRDLILRDVFFAQLVVGFVASAVVPLLTVVMLLSLGQRPLLGWGSLWQWLVMAAAGAVFTPLFSLTLRRLGRVFTYPSLPESTFHSNREMKRGRT